MDAEYFCGDFLKEVSPLTLYKLKLSNKNFNKYITLDIIKTSIIKEINRRLTIIFGDKLNNFKQVLDNNKAIISGSFIIQCILGEYWTNSDIDIFSPVDHIDYNPNFDYSDMEKFLMSTDLFDLTEDYVMDYGGSPSVIRDFKSFINETKIQIIEKEIPKDYKEINKFINGYFDFNICCNMFYHENNMDKVEIFDINNIFNKIIKCEDISSQGRYEKYFSRGFNIITDTFYERKFILVFPTNVKNKYIISDEYCVGQYFPVPHVNDIVTKLPEKEYKTYSTICHDKCNYSAVHFHYTYSFCDYIFYIGD
jgi:hypothetical protein